MTLYGFWFGVIAVLWAGFLVLEGFDFGVGMLHRFVGRTVVERDIALSSIGPVWDGNEVWLLVAGGATFAAFPEWYATVFSAYYLAFALLLVGLIIRGIGIEYRAKVETAAGRTWCETGITVGSFLPALLLGVAFADFMYGIKLDKNHVMAGSFWSLLKPYALLGGLTTLLFFAFHGAVYLALRTEGVVSERSAALARQLVWPTGAAAAAFLIWTTQVRGGWLSEIVAVAIVVALVAGIRPLYQGRFGWTFASSALVALLLPVWVFACLWPDVVPASNGSAFSLTAKAAASSHHTLAVMTGVALLVTPIVLAYQAWTYWVFRARIGAPMPAYASTTVSAVAEQARKFGSTPHQ
ncbi:MAG TPA: cytochrome d ubiquinol oxidase subunit II [Jatrophihabitans sp.]|jgi:cytochrome d ubiquinol oxidase subunit II|nr:cytochrome d ubiquinol oxidase subunit II [Jatrophihabitans sp.]